MSIGTKKRLHPQQEDTSAKKGSGTPLELVGEGEEGARTIVVGNVVLQSHLYVIEEGDATTRCHHRAQHGLCCAPIGRTLAIVQRSPCGEANKGGEHFGTSPVIIGIGGQTDGDVVVGIDIFHLSAVQITFAILGIVVIAQVDTPSIGRVFPLTLPPDGEAQSAHFLCILRKGDGIV